MDWNYICFVAFIAQAINLMGNLNQRTRYFT